MSNFARLQGQQTNQLGLDQNQTGPTAEHLKSLLIQRPYSELGLFLQSQCERSDSKSNLTQMLADFGCNLLLGELSSAGWQMP